MLVWNTDLIYLDHHTLPNGEVQTVGIGCDCQLCGPVVSDVMLVRFDQLKEHETPQNRYPRQGVCRDCITKAQQVLEERIQETGMVRIGSAFRCSHCKDKVSPLIWFDVHATTEQFICARCLVEAQKKFLVLQEHLAENCLDND